MNFTLVIAAALRLALLEIGDSSIAVEIADCDKTRSQGLMHRDFLPENTGMLFVYEKPENLCFWMKNTKMPLSIGFFDEEQKLIQIENMDPPKFKSESLPLYKSRSLAKYALEAPKNWFKDHNIPIGAKFTLHEQREAIK